MTYSEHHRQGRTSFAEWLKDEIFGRDYVEISDDPERLFGKHAEGRVGKIMCSFNEASLAATASHEERLKAFITDVSDTVNAKGIRAREVSNYCRWFFQTNNPVAVKMGSEDMRYWPVAYDSPGPAGSEGWVHFWGKMGPALDDVEVTPRAFMDYLHRRFGPGAPQELSEKFNFQTHRPASRLLTAAMVRCREPHLEFATRHLQQLAAGEISTIPFHYSRDGSVWYKRSALWQAFKTWKQDEEIPGGGPTGGIRTSKVLNSILLLTPGFEDRKRDGYDCWCIQPKKLLEFLLSKGVVDSAAQVDSLLEKINHQVTLSYGP